MDLRENSSTLHLVDLLQQVRTSRGTGTLTLTKGTTSARLYFRKGQLTLLAHDGRLTLMDALVDAGLVAAATVEQVRKKRRGTRKSLCATLVATQGFERSQLVDFALRRLKDDVSRILRISCDECTFHEGRMPRRVFDAEERRLSLKIPVDEQLLRCIPAPRSAEHAPAPRRAEPVHPHMDRTGSIAVLFEPTGEAPSPPHEEDPSGIQPVQLDQPLEVQPSGLRTILDTSASVAALDLALGDGDVLARVRRRQRMAFVRRVVGTTMLVFAVTWLALEGAARFSYAQAQRIVERSELVEQQRFEEARMIFQRVAEDYPLTTAAWFVVPRRIEELRSAHGTANYGM